MFDLNNFKDYPDFLTFKPRMATGINYLLINGKIIIQDGINTHSKNGYIIKNN
ncbi:hypothetical protein LLG07_06795 [bacterium]|nr:hypothetical protein [bacterium]